MPLFLFTCFVTLLRWEPLLLLLFCVPSSFCWSRMAACMLCECILLACAVFVWVLCNIIIIIVVVVSIWVRPTPRPVVSGRLNGRQKSFSILKLEVERFYFVGSVVSLLAGKTAVPFINHSPGESSFVLGRSYSHVGEWVWVWVWVFLVVGLCLRQPWLVLSVRAWYRGQRTRCVLETCSFFTGLKRFTVSCVRALRHRHACRTLYIAAQRRPAGELTVP